MQYNQMRTVFHIFVLIIVVAIFSIINFSTDKSNSPEIVIVGNDTLGRNWDNLPSAQEIQQAKYNNQYSEDEVLPSSNKELDFEPIDFSDRIETNKGNNETVISADGREIIVE
jgi:hypothetical protein